MEIRKNKDSVFKPDVFKYLDYRKFLKEYYCYRKALNPSFSYKVFAQKCDMAKSQLHCIVDNRRKLSNAKAALVAEAAGLNKWESDYFLTLVLWNQCDEENIRAIYWERLVRLSPKDSFYTINELKQDIVSRWYVLALLEMIRLEDFKFDYSWISKRLSNRVSVDEIKETFDLLILLGFVKVKDGRVKLSNKTVISDGDHIPAKLVRDYHKKNIPIGIDAIDDIDPTLREFSTLSIAVRKDKLQTIKEKLRSYCYEILEYVESDVDAEDVYQLNLQFFPLTSPVDDKAAK